LTWLWKWNSISSDAGASAFFFGAWGSDNTYTGGGGLNVCASDGAMTSSTGMCSTTTGFTNTYSSDGGKVFISETTKAGGSLTGAVSKYLMKACVTNGASPGIPTDAVLGNFFLSCKITKASYFSEKGGTNA